MSHLIVDGSPISPGARFTAELESWDVVRAGLMRFPFSWKAHEMNSGSNVAFNLEYWAASGVQAYGWTMTHQARGESSRPNGVVDFGRRTLIGRELNL